VFEYLKFFLQFPAGYQSPVKRIPTNFFKTALFRQKKFTEEDAAKITRQIFDALAYLHDIGIVHRDLKVNTPLWCNATLSRFWTKF